jgi:hypothetical protein
MVPLLFLFYIYDNSWKGKFQVPRASGSGNSFVYLFVLLRSRKVLRDLKIGTESWQRELSKGHHKMIAKIEADRGLK